MINSMPCHQIRILLNELFCFSSQSMLTQKLSWSRKDHFPRLKCGARALLAALDLNSLASLSRYCHCLGSIIELEGMLAPINQSFGSK